MIRIAPTLCSKWQFLLFSLVIGCRPPALARPGPSDADEAARQAIANERALDPATIPARTLGVAPWRIAAVDSSLAPLGYGLADLLMTDLGRSAQIQLVDRVRLDALLRELRLAEAGRVDTATAPRVGKLVGARRLIIGDLAQIPNSDLRISANIADVATSEIRGSVSASAPIDAILDAEKALAFQLFDELGIVLTPAERAAVEQRPTKNISALLAYSRGARAEVHGQYDLARDEYREALRLDPAFYLASTRIGDLDARSAGSEGNAAAARAERRRQALSRAATAAAEGVNRTFTLGIGGAADPSFTSSQTMTIIVTITTTP